MISLTTVGLTLSEAHLPLLYCSYLQERIGVPKESDKIFPFVLIQLKSCSFLNLKTIATIPKLSTFHLKLPSSPWPTYKLKSLTTSGTYAFLSFQLGTPFPFLPLDY